MSQIEPADEIEQMLSEAETEIANLSNHMKTCREKYKEFAKRKQDWETYVQRLKGAQLSKPLKRKYADVD